MFVYMSSWDVQYYDIFKVLLAHAGAKTCRNSDIYVLSVYALDMYGENMSIFEGLSFFKHFFLCSNGHTTTVGLVPPVRRLLRPHQLPPVHGD